MLPGNLIRDELIRREPSLSNRVIEARRSRLSAPVRYTTEASILIPCFNGERYLKQCLETLFTTKGVSFETIIVDNASTDNSLEIARSYPPVTVIANGRNVGFPVAINQGASLAKGEFLVILNQDTEVEPNWLLELITVLRQNPKVAICGPKILDSKNRAAVQQLGVMVDRFGFAIYIQNLNQVRSEVFMVSGAAMVIRHDVFKTLGGFDEDYFIFEDDLDLCWRARLAGYKVMVDSSSIVFHRGGSAVEGGFPEKGQFKTSLTRRYFSERNTLQTLLKNYETANIMKRVPPYIGMNLAEIALFVLSGQINGTIAYVRSFYYNIVRFRKTWQKHVEIGRIRAISDRKLSAVQDPRNLKIQAFLRWGVPTFEGKGPRPAWSPGRYTRNSS